MAVARDFSIPLALILILMMVYLLMLGRLSGITFAFSLLGVAVLVAVTAVVVPHSEQVSKISGKVSAEGGQLLVEMKELQRDVYAKAAHIKKLTEQIGEIAALNVAWLWSWAPDNSSAERVRLRDKLASMLRDAETEETRISEIVKPINERITVNLAHAVRVPMEPFSKGSIKGQTAEIASLKVLELLLASEIGQAQAAVKPYLQDLGCWTNEVATQVREFDEFRRTKQISSDK
jgi:hypothetical protein